MQEALVQVEHEELISMNHDLMRKLQAERAEITRLREEIQEMQTLYGYRLDGFFFIITFYLQIWISLCKIF